MLIDMKAWLQVGLAIAVLLTVAVITVHPDFDLMDGIPHAGHDLTSLGFLLVATLIKLNELMAASLPSPELVPAQARRGPDSLDLICVRLC
jgi:hypothetical protein